MSERERERERQRERQREMEREREKESVGTLLWNPLAARARQAKQEVHG